MVGKQILLRIGIVSLGFAAGPASAYVTAALDGFYIEANAGKSFATSKSFPGRIYNSRFGWNVNAGYKLMEYIGAELDYSRYAATRILNSAGTTAATDWHYSYGAAAKLYFPLWGSGFELFTKLGVVRIHSFTHVINLEAAALNHLVFQTGTHTATAPYFGAGFDYSVHPNVQINLQWAEARGNSGTGHLNLYSAGLTFLY